jgi:serine/threonine-protein kinase
VDGGTHLIEAVTPGGGRWTTSVRVRDEKDEVAVRIEPPAPASAPAPPAPSASVPPPAPTAAPAPVAPGPPEPAAKEAAIPRRTLGLALGGVGLVGVAVGSFFGWKTIEKKNASNADGHCNASNVCDRVGTELRNEGKSAATLATVFMGIGAASLVGGAVLFLTAPPEETRQGKVRLAPLVGQDGGGLSLRGAW